MDKDVKLNLIWAVVASILILMIGVGIVLNACDRRTHIAMMDKIAKDHLVAMAKAGYIQIQTREGTTSWTKRTTVEKTMTETENQRGMTKE
jgi:flagellar basal body rod protein FlgG